MNDSNSIRLFWSQMITFDSCDTWKKINCLLSDFSFCGGRAISIVEFSSMFFNNDRLSTDDLPIKLRGIYDHSSQTT